MNFILARLAQSRSLATLDTCTLALSIAATALPAVAQTLDVPAERPTPGVDTAGSVPPTPTNPAPDPSDARSTPPRLPPYSIPWQLRPVAAANVIRSDTAVAFYEPPGSDSGTTVASMLLASFKVTNEIAPLARVGLVHASLPNGQSATHLTNPVLGATFAPKLSPNYRLGLFLGLAFPLGGGGGNPPSASHAAANAAAASARSAMDNAMAAANYFTIFPGVGFAYVASGLTAQAEVTLLQLTHARGPESEDGSRTNLTMGLHLGYFLLPSLSIGAELRHQRWLSTPAMVRANAAARDTSTFAIGPRLHVPIGAALWLRPGVAFAMPIDDPMSQSEYKILQIDVPFVF